MCQFAGPIVFDHGINLYVRPTTSSEFLVPCPPDKMPNVGEVLQVGQGVQMLVALNSLSRRARKSSIHVHVTTWEGAPLGEMYVKIP